MSPELFPCKGGESVIYYTGFQFAVLAERSTPMGWALCNLYQVKGCK